MKPHLFLKLFFCAFASLFILQGIWLYYAYQTKRSEIEEVLNTIFTNATEREMESRLMIMDNLLTDKMQQLNVSTSSLMELQFDYEKEIYSQQSDFMQEVLVSEGINFSLSILDSIFSCYLVDKNLQLDYQLLYTDSSNIIIKSIGTDINNGFQTNKIHIVNGYGVQAIIKISPPIILKNMLVILFISVCIFVLIAICLIYLINAFLSQHHLNQLRENFSHALTHDMKTPLGTIFTVLDQLKKGTLEDNSEMKSQFIQVGIEQTANLQAIVNQILTVAYIEKKQLNLNKEPINLPQIIRTIINKFTVKGGKEIFFTEDYRLGDVSVFADRLYLSNAISNLIDNAIKYSYDSVKIRISCVVSHKQIQIRIADNGFGISNKDQRKIFDRFERGAEIKRNKISGFGLGLSYVKAVVEAHDGTVSVHSRPKEGSEFIITIPISDDTEEL